LHIRGSFRGLTSPRSIFMVGWQYSIASAFERLRAEWRIKRESVRIARTIYPPLWENVRRKIPGTSGSDLTVYAKVRAAQLAQEKVDVIMQANPALSGTFATRLLLKSTDRAVDSVLAAVANARRAAA
jgi:hypothetical protein